MNNILSDIRFKHMLLRGSLIISSISTVSASTIDMETQYQDIKTNKNKRTERSLIVNDSRRSYVSDKGIEKTIMLSRLANIFIDSLGKNENLLNVCYKSYSTNGKEETINSCNLKTKRLAKGVSKDFTRFNKEYARLNISDIKVDEFIAVGKKLVENIESQKLTYYRQQQHSSNSNSQQHNRMQQQPQRNYNQQQQPQQQQIQQQAQQQQGQSGVSVSAGGAQDASHFKKMVLDGLIPSSDSFTVEGFLSEFSFPLNLPTCKDILCVNPVYKINRNTNKLYVQLGMGTNVDSKTFKRSKLNLSVVLDVSGSMDANDRTEISRVEWAKKSLLQTLDKLTADDYLSIVLFNTDSKVVMPATKVKNKTMIRKIIKEISAGGSTNLGKGLLDGFNEVSRNFKEGYENRVILISDAGANTGATSEADLLKIVSDFSGENIGLTAIGIGLNFNQKLIHAISMSKGGNYLFVNSGKGIKNYINQFDFLVSPIAYNFKANLELRGISGKLVKAYGIPMKKGAEIQKVLDIRTLFLTSSDRGGAILLEYDLE